MTEEEKKPEQTPKPAASVAPASRELGEAFYTDLGMKAVQVGPRLWAFQQLAGDDLKRLERKARNPRTGETDGRRLLHIWYDTVVLGEAVTDLQGNCIGVKPDSKFEFSQLSAPALNAFEAELTSFLGYFG